MTIHDQEALMIRYLLGTATEEEQAQLEEKFFADDDLFQQLKALEDELRYEYARGGLTDAERRAFEARFITSAEDRKKVELAKQVLAKAHELARAAPRVSIWQSFASLFAAPRLAMAASALAVVVLAAGSFFAIQTVQLRQEVARGEAQRKRDQQTIAAAQQRQGELAQELERAKQQPGSSGAPTAELSFVLTPGLVRDAAGTKRLVVASGEGVVTLQLETKAKGFASYRAELQNLDGDVLFSSKASSSAFKVPARVLKPGDYMVALKGINASGDSTDAGEFYFQVVRR
jgi:hypothetical protein